MLGFVPQPNLQMHSFLLPPTSCLLSHLIDNEIGQKYAAYLEFSLF